MVRRITIETSVGPVTASFDDEAVREVRFGAHGAGEPATGDPHGLRARFERYFGGDGGAFDGLPIAPEGTSFQHAVWAVMRAIPFGETLTYAQVAERIGKNPRTTSRAVGGASGANRLPIVIPCHRVVGSDGSLTGFGGGLGVKKALLEHERAGLFARG